MAKLGDHNERFDAKYVQRCSECPRLLKMQRSLPQHFLAERIKTLNPNTVKTMWKNRYGARSGCPPKPSRFQAFAMVMLSWPLLLGGPRLYASDRAFLSKPKAWPTLSTDVAEAYKPSRVFQKPSNPKWTWPLSLAILTFSLSASSFHPRDRLSSSTVKLQAFAGGLEGCDHHGAGRYEFEALLGMLNFLVDFGLPLWSG